MFEAVDAGVRLPQVEEKVLQFWREHDIFRQTLALRRGRPEYIFFEGPPTANGRPGVHHAQARTYKDLIPRYKTMRGYLVQRKAGWDCHGLPVELEVETRLQFSGKAMIEQYGVGPFNKECRASVMEYEQAWRQLTERIGFWVDMDNAYMTLSNGYVESVWWSLKRLWDQGLIYQGYKVLPYCPRCGTPLSSHEVGLGYQDIDDPSIFVRFPLKETLGLEGRVSLLVWTTTPWTLPGNTAAAVHPNLKYVAAKVDDETFILAEQLLNRVLGEGKYTTMAEFSADRLVGLSYEPPFRHENPEGKAYVVVAGDFVTAEDGTGIVHIAPAFGADDMEMSRQHGLAVLRTLQEDGRFPASDPLVGGQFFREANPVISRDLKQRGILYRQETYRHSYPHCWRCSTPLVYYATTSWFIRNSSRKADLIRKNLEINWFPSHIKEGRFGDWLENLVDWALSRSRYWGTPLPIWICGGCDHREMIGSYAELAGRAQQSVDPASPEFDPHRPFVDDITFECPKCQGTMKRISDVIDCWYDSGSMPFAQWHYPFENEERFKQSFPADFICEGLDQTRGWFNSLHQLGVMLFDSIAYKNVICHGLVLDKNGDKMSKTKGNVVNPWDVVEAHGADALRWYLYTSSPPEFNRRFSVDLVGEACRGFLMTLWNTYSFFVLYANEDKPELVNRQPVAERPGIDRWIIARLHQTIAAVTRELDAYNLTPAARALAEFVDDLSNWYVRRNRRRFWKSESDQDKQAAYQTLYECLVTAAKLAAPFVPFMAEAIYRNLSISVDTLGPMSVHLCDWPEADARLQDQGLLADTASTIQAVSLGRAARAASGVKVRQPLPEVLIRARSAEERDALIRFSDQIAEELNVHKVTLLAQDADMVQYNLKPNLKLVGKKYGKKVPLMKEALAAADSRDIARRHAAGQTIPLRVDGEVLELLPEEVLVEARSAEGYSVQEGGGLLVALDVRVTDELRLEGVARDIVRHVQQTRKNAGLHIADRIRVSLGTSDDTVRRAVDAHRAFISQEVLAEELTIGDTLSSGHVATADLDGAPLTVALLKV